MSNVPHRRHPRRDYSTVPPPQDNVSYFAAKEIAQPTTKRETPSASTSPLSKVQVPQTRRVFRCASSVPADHIKMTSTTSARASRGNKRQCMFCSRTFSKTEHLERHVRSHTKEKPFHCQHCGRKYGRKCVREVPSLYSLANDVVIPS